MKRSLFLLGLLLVTRPGIPLMNAQEKRINVPYTQFVLPNGLNVILHEDHTTPTVAVNVWYHVGSGREKQGRTGFAHLFEHIMFEGSGNVAEGKFDQWLEAAGGGMDAWPRSASGWAAGISRAGSSALARAWPVRLTVGWSPGCWRRGRGHRCGERGGVTEAPLPGACLWGRR